MCRLSGFCLKIRSPEVFVGPKALKGFGIKVYISLGFRVLGFRGGP